MEARNLNEQQFGVKRLSEVLKKNHQARAAEIRTSILKSVREFCGNNFDDDITLVVISVQ